MFNFNCFRSSQSSLSRNSLPHTIVSKKAPPENTKGANRLIQNTKRRYLLTRSASKSVLDNTSKCFSKTSPPGIARRRQHKSIMCTKILYSIARTSNAGPTQTVAAVPSCVKAPHAVGGFCPQVFGQAFVRFCSERIQNKHFVFKSARNKTY